MRPQQRHSAARRPTTKETAESASAGTSKQQVQHQHDNHPQSTPQQAPPTRIATAAFLAVTGSLEGRLTSVSQLRAVLQQAGVVACTDGLLGRCWRENASNNHMDLAGCQRALNSWLPRFQRAADVRRAFSRLDADNDGVLSVDELAGVLGARLSTSELQAAFQRADLNSDGRVDYAEFVRMLQAHADAVVQANLAKLDEHERKKSKPRVREHEQPVVNGGSGPAVTLTSNSAAAVRRRPSVKEYRRTSVSSSARSSSRAEQASKASSSVASSTAHDRSRKHNDVISENNNDDDSLVVSSAASSVNNGVMVLKEHVADKVKFTMPSTKEMAKNYQMDKLQSEWPTTNTIKGCAFYNDDGTVDTHTYDLSSESTTEIIVQIKATTTGSAPSTSRAALWLAVVDGSSQEVVAVTDRCNKEGVNYCRLSLTGNRSYTLVAYTCGTGTNTSPAGKPDRSALLDANGRLSKRARVALMDVFDAFDLDDSGGLSRREFGLYNERTGDEPVGEDEWTVVKSKLHTTPNGELSMRGFIALHQMELDDQPAEDLDDLCLALEQVGYDDKLALTRAQPFVIEIKREKDQSSIKLEPKDISSRYTSVSWRRCMDFLRDKFLTEKDGQISYGLIGRIFVMIADGKITVSDADNCVTTVVADSHTAVLASSIKPEINWSLSAE